MAEAIDIGSACIDRSESNEAGWKRINKGNPSNASGIITTVEIWAVTNLTGCEVGIFYRPDPASKPNSFICRAMAVIGSVTAGSKQTFTGLSLAVEVGDYIGYYYTLGTAEVDSSGGEGVWYRSNPFYVGVEVTYFLASGYVVSLYGTGVITKISSQLGYGVDAKVSGNPVATLTKAEVGGGIDVSAKGMVSSDAGYCGEVLEG